MKYYEEDQNGEEKKLEPNGEKSRTVYISRNNSLGNIMNIKISKKNIDDTFVEEVNNIHSATNSITSVLNILEDQITELNEKFEKEKKRARRKEWINRGRNRKGKYYWLHFPIYISFISI